MVTIVNAFGGSNGPQGTASSYATNGTVYGGTPNKNSAVFPQVGGLGTGFKIFAQPAATSSVFQLNVPGEFILEGQQFTIRASGWVYVAGSTPNIQVGLFSGTSLTSSSDTAITELPATAATLTTSNYYPWALEVRLQGDSNSGILQGIANLMLDNVFTSSSAITALTGISFGNSLGSGVGSGSSTPPVQLAVGINFGVSNAANLAQLAQFSLEA